MVHRLIAKKLVFILKEFSILSKVQNIITDNATNFVKAFSLYNHSQTADDVSDGASVNGVMESDDSKSEDYLDMININDSLDTVNPSINEDEETEDSEGFFLPPHKRCGNHSLNLVATVDAAKAREDKAYQRIFDRVMAKIQALWNAVSRSPKQNDVVDEIAGKTFIQPTCTRWCSEYYAAERIVEVGLEKVVKCQQALGQTKMTEAEMKFLNGYLFTMKPVVKATKVLEGESDCYLGVLIPTIMGIQSILKTISDMSMKPLVNALQSGLHVRFEHVMKSHEYKIASMLHPKFKMAFLSNNEKMQMKEILISYVKDVQQEVSKKNGNHEQSSNSLPEVSGINNDDLYSFLSQKTEVDSTIVDEVEGYLANKSDLVSSLLAYPTVAEAFRKSNSSLPSSAAVERMFSAASQILTARRCKMADEMLDQLLFLRSMYKADNILLC